MATDARYDYPIMVASKVIIRRGDQILLTREPLDNSWMPGRLGLPGGKYYLNEGAIDGTTRKITNEAGVKCEIKGLFKIIQILMPEKTVYHFVLVADYSGDDSEVKDVYSAGLEWMNRDQILGLSTDQLTEYYLPEVLKDYFANPERITPLDSMLIELQSYKDPAIQEWMHKGRKENK